MTLKLVLVLFMLLMTHGVEIHPNAATLEKAAQEDLAAIKRWAAQYDPHSIANRTAGAVHKNRTEKSCKVKDEWNMEFWRHIQALRSIHSFKKAIGHLRSRLSSCKKRMANCGSLATSTCEPNGDGDFEAYFAIFWIGVHLSHLERYL